jgi:hypothetical protein
VTIPGDVPAQVLGEWQSGEERLYPVVMVRPDLYQRSVELVRAVADELQSCTDVAGLVTAWAEAAEIVYRTSSVALLPLADLDHGLIAGAAFMLRYRELAWPAARRDRIERVRQAAEGGDDWVRVDETGSRETAGMMPWAWVDMHVPTATGLRQTIEADPHTGAPRYSLEVVRLDPETGDVLCAPDDPTMEESFDDRAEWMAAVEAKRREIAGNRR